MKLGVGRRRKAELSPDESQRMIDDIINRTVDVRSAKVSISDQITGELEYVDLIENKLCTVIEYNIGKRERLHLNKFFPEVVKEFLKVKSKKYI